MRNLKTDACKRQFMTKIATMLLGLFAASALVACHGENDSLVGTYAEAGKLDRPLFCIELTNGQYVLSEYHKGSWQEASEQPKQVTAQDFEVLTKHKVDVPVIGVQTKGFALIHVPRGWNGGSFSSKTGYFAVIWSKPVELEKL